MKKMRTVTRVLGSKELVLDGIQQLRKGNLFKMYEPHSYEPVIDKNGRSIFKAISEPYFSDDVGSWMIDIEDTTLH